MTTPSTITTTEVSGEDISKVLDAIMPIIEDFPRHHIIIACISLAITLQAPRMTAQTLYGAIQSTSRHICTLITEDEETIGGAPLAPTSGLVH